MQIGVAGNLAKVKLYTRIRIYSLGGCRAGPDDPIVTPLALSGCAFADCVLCSNIVYSWIVDG